MATSEEQTEPADPAEPHRPQETPPRRSGSGSLLVVALLGGFLAGGIGYLAAYYTEFGLFETGPAPEITQRMDQQAARLDEIEAQLQSATGPAPETQDTLQSLQDQLSEVTARLDDMAGQEPSSGDDPRVAQLSQTVSDLQSQVSNLPTNTAAASRVSEIGQAVEDLRAQIAQAGQGAESRSTELQTQLTALEQRLTQQGEALRTAEAEARETSVLAAIARIRAALSDGEAYAPALDTLRSDGDVQIPEALSAPAGSGVATLPSLQESFDEAARQALAASVSESTDGPLDRTIAFLRAQTGARSLDAREGGSPDAILSRARASLTDGDLEAALSELDALPEGGRQAMSDWLDRARTRAQASAALADLSTSSTNN